MINIIDTNLKFKRYGIRNETNYIILHHVGAPFRTVEQIHQQHLNQGWAGIGYHFYVRKDGSIYKGREINAIGAHCPGRNYDSIGICAEGNYHDHPKIPVDYEMLEVQKNSIINLCIYLINEKKYSNVEIGRHRDYYATDCPGDYYPFNEIFQRIQIGNYVEEVVQQMVRQLEFEQWMGNKGREALNVLNNTQLPSGSMVIDEPSRWNSDDVLQQPTPLWLTFEMMRRLVEIINTK